MATVFMKWLETSPKDYDRGIQLLTLGRLTPLKERIAREYVREGTRVLEIGCGTGTLTKMMLERGARVSALDASSQMLTEAENKLGAYIQAGSVTISQMDATLIGDRFEHASFDLIVSTLVFSELAPNDQKYVLNSCYSLLAPGGRLLIADEVIPTGGQNRLIFSMVRGPLVLLTWLLTRTTTAALTGFDEMLAEAGYIVSQPVSMLGGSLVLFEGVARTAEAISPEETGEDDSGIATCCVPCAIQSVVGKESARVLPSGVAGRLSHQVTFRTRLIDLWQLFFRIVPPYPKVRPGLYAVGQPDPGSPVLVTGNYDLTVRRVVQAIDRKVDAWLLVADSAGINVWCAAGGGYFTAEKVIAAVKSSRLSDVVRHHALILPQLAANGVDGWKVRQETGWGVHWGPARAEDIPTYLRSKRKKTDTMRWVTFPLKARMEMTAAVAGFYVILLGIVLAIFWRPVFWPAMGAAFVLSLFYGVFLPWIPGHDGIGKGAVIAGLSAAFVLAWGLGVADWMPEQLWNWSLGMGFLAFFVGAEFQGMSPLMRGEQGNWGIEALVGLGTLAVYFLPRLAGWWGG